MKLSTTAPTFARMVVAVTLAMATDMVSSGLASAAPACGAAQPTAAPQVVETTTAGSQSTIQGGIQLASYPFDKIALIGGQQLSPDESDPSAYKFGWKYQPHSIGPVGYPSPKGWAVQFGVTGTRDIEFLVYARSNAAWNLTIDGSPVWDIPRTTPIATNDTDLIKFSLPDGGPHTVQFYMNNLSLSSIFGDHGSSLVSRPISGPRVFFLGDSLTQGGPQSTGGDLGSWIWRFARQCGFTDVWNGGLGATGAMTDGDTTNYETRATTDVAPANPDLVFISSYFNDYLKPASDIAAAFGRTIDTVRNLSPKSAIVVIGAFDPHGDNLAPFDAIDPDMRDVCVHEGVPYIEPRTGLAYRVSGDAVTPAGMAGPWITHANKDLYIGSDNTHQTDAGQAYMAQRIYEAYRAVN